MGHLRPQLLQQLALPLQNRDGLNPRPQRGQQGTQSPNLTQIDRGHPARQGKGHLREKVVHRPQVPGNQGNVDPR